MKKQIDKLIPLAFKAVDACLKNPDGTVDKQYNGYIASFGASVIQSGMMAALIFNNRASGEGSSEKERKNIIDAIFYVVSTLHNGQPGSSDLIDYYANRLSDQKKVKRQILDIAAAIKLVMRTYEKSKEADEHTKPPGS